MADISNARVLTEAIGREVSGFIQREAEKSIQEAVDKFEADLRLAVGAVAVKMAREVNFEQFQDRLRIEVRIQDGKA